MKPAKNYTIRIRVWVDEETGPYLGTGRVLLLEKIKETGSITHAAAELKMSYRQAWQLVQDMNSRAGEPLVEKKLGGSGGGGALLTAAGIRAIEKFHTLEKSVLRYSKAISKEIRF